jgi:hypothetical protein
VNWRDEWSAIASRIQGLMAAAEFYLRTLRVNSQEERKVSLRLVNQATSILSTIETFVQKHRSSLPLLASESMNEFVQEVKRAIGTDIPGVDCLKKLTAFACLRAEIDYYLSDFAFQARRQSERAFTHLQQLIVADKSVQERWQAAYEEGEPACERLGAAHLLLHGIWGFKVRATGAETDLVYKDLVYEESFDPAEAAPVADAIVLTEWKVVRDTAEVEKIAADARNQTALYASGVLGGLELAEYRYIVLVSQDRLKPQADVMGQVTYRHVNIAVNPSTPSRSPRTQK